MADKITEGAILLCDKGVKPSQLKVTSQDFCKAQEKLIATAQDLLPEVNIPNFGVCSIMRSNCIPSILKWNDTAEIDSINEQKILTEDSTCNCTVGGKISIQHKGHTEIHSVD